MRVYATLLLVCLLLQIPWWKPRRIERILFSSPSANQIEIKKKKRRWLPQHFMKKTCSKWCPPIKVHKLGRRARCCYSHHLLRWACTMWSFFRQFSSCLFTFLYTGNAHTTEKRNASGQGKKKKQREHPVKASGQGILPGCSFPVHLLHLRLQPRQIPHSILPTRSPPYCLVPLQRWWASRSIFSSCCYSFPSQLCDSLKHF